jgi:hypothetical protein
MNTSIASSPSTRSFRLDAPVWSTAFIRVVPYSQEGKRTAASLAMTRATAAKPPVRRAERSKPPRIPLPQASQAGISETPIFLNVLASALLRIPWSAETRRAPQFDGHFRRLRRPPCGKALPFRGSVLDHSPAATPPPSRTRRRFSRGSEIPLFLNVLDSARPRPPACLDSLDSKNSFRKSLPYSPLFSSILPFAQGPFAFTGVQSASLARSVRAAPRIRPASVISLTAGRECDKG